MSLSSYPTIKVVAAVIVDDLQKKTKVYATARGYGEFRGQWEFPGGKVEDHESPEQALIREIKEELTVDIEVGDLIMTIEYDYPNFHLSMDCFWAVIKSGELKLIEAKEAGWFNKDELDRLDWLPADTTLVEKIKAKIGQ